MNLFGPMTMFMLETLVRVKAEVYIKKAATKIINTFS